MHGIVGRQRVFAAPWWSNAHILPTETDSTPVFDPNVFGHSVLQGL